MSESLASPAETTAPQAAPAAPGLPSKPAVGQAADRIAVLDLALSLAARIDNARLRLPAWLALGSCAVLFYLVVVPVPGRRLGVADGFVIAFVAAATGLLVYWEWLATRRCRDLLRALPAPAGAPAKG